MQTDHNRNADFTSADATSVARCGSFRLDMTADRAFPLFTGPGEKLWVPGWNPVVLAGDGLEKGSVFVTTAQGRKTFWMVMDFDRQERRALYVRTTPEIDTGTVEVRVASDGGEGAIVEVSYRLTALSGEGNEKLRNAFGEPEYAKMMQDWRRLICQSHDRIEDHLGLATEH